MKAFPRITHDPRVMGGRACIRGMRVTVAMVMNQIAAGCTQEQVLADYPYLERDDIREALAYAAWRLNEQEFDLRAA